MPWSATQSKKFKGSIKSNQNKKRVKREREEKQKNEKKKDFFQPQAQQKGTKKAKNSSSLAQQEMQIDEDEAGFHDAHLIPDNFSIHEQVGDCEAYDEERIGDNNSRNDKLDKNCPVDDFVFAVRARLKEELNSKKTNTGVKFLLEHLKINDFWIRECHVPYLSKLLQLNFDEDLRYYYGDIKCWLPEIQWGETCMPVCPCCKRQKNVMRHDLGNLRKARRVFDLDRSVYVIAYRYKCAACYKTNEKKRDDLKRKLEGVANALNFKVKVQVVNSENDDNDNDNDNDDDDDDDDDNDDDEVRDEARKVSTGIFSGFAQNVLRLLPKDKGALFPFFLSYQSGLSKRLMDLCVPLFCKGIRPEALASACRELSALRFTREHIDYESSNSSRGLFMSEAKPFSSMSDKKGYNQPFFSAAYLRTMFIRQEEERAAFCDVELKKRDSKQLYWDASFKVASLLSTAGGEPLFKALITATNEYGEIRIQFFVVTDGQDQFKYPCQKFNETVEAYGQAELDFLWTDNVGKDKAFFHQVFSSLKKKEEEINRTLINQKEVNHSFSSSFSLNSLLSPISISLFFPILLFSPFSIFFLIIISRCFFSLCTSFILLLLAPLFLFIFFLLILFFLYFFSFLNAKQI